MDRKLEQLLRTDSRAREIRQLFNRYAYRDPTLSEVSQYRRIGAMDLVPIIKTIAQNENHLENAEKEIIRGQAIDKHFGISLVSTYNKQCGIATYTENLHREFSKLIQSNVISETSRNRENGASEDGVKACWNVAGADYEYHVLKAANDFENQIVLIQHEYGLFLDNGKFLQMLQNLKRAGYTVVIQAHTILADNKHMDIYFGPADLIVVHSEMAAYRLYSNGVNNVTVLPHGTEEPYKVYEKGQGVNFVRGMIPGYQNGLTLGVSLGFVTPNKMQKEVMQAAKLVCEEIPDFRFLLAGSSGRRDCGPDYADELREEETEKVVFKNTFLSDQDIALIMSAADFCVYNYSQTNFSISGASHLAMTYGKPCISSHSRILEDLTPDMSIKIARSHDVNELADAMIKLARDEDMRFQMGRSARVRGEETSWDKVAKRHIQIYKKLLENRQ